jgi:hypothetical protein
MISGSFEGMLYGSGLNGEGKGRIAKAPPPLAFQLIEIYRYKERD